MIGYLEPHDRPETSALAEGLEVVPRRRAGHGVARARRARPGRGDPAGAGARARRRARAHERARLAQREALRGHRRGARGRDRRDLDRQRAAPREPQRRRVRADGRPGARDVPRPDPRRRRRGDPRRPLAGGAAAAAARRQGLPARPGRGRARELLPRPTTSRPSASSRCARSSRTSGARRHANVLDPLSTQAVGERILALVKPEPSAQRLLRRAWRSAQRLGAELDALWVRTPGEEPSDEQKVAARGAAAARDHPRRALHRGGGGRPRRRRCGGSWSTAARPTSCSARPTRAAGARSRAARCSRAMVRELPGVDIRVVADRSRRQELERVRLGGTRPYEAAGRPRILVPFAGELDPVVLDAAIRIARAEQAVLVPGVPAAACRSSSGRSRPRPGRSGRRCRCSRRSSRPRSARASSPNPAGMLAA